MAIRAPETETEQREQTQTQTERIGRWVKQALTRIGLDLGGEKEPVSIENQTDASWLIHHNFRQLGILDPGETREYFLVRKGKLTMRPHSGEKDVDYLIAPLTNKVWHVLIYIRRVNTEVEMYDLKVA